jgi:hopanoid biosynthesis associated radical SAM protein HpnH
MPRIVEGYIERKKFVILCTNALLLKKKIDDYKPSPFFTWSIHLDGDKQMHDRRSIPAPMSRSRSDRAGQVQGFRVQVNCTVFDGADPDRLAAFFDEMKSRDVEITVSPGYAYERAADQEHFLNRERTKQFFRDVFSRGNKGKNWKFTNSPLFLDFLAGNQTYECTPWSMPLRTVFGWQKPCYLLGEGYVESFRRTDGRHRLGKVRRRQVREVRELHDHCGFEGTAATDAIRHPLKMMKVARKGVKTDGPMAPESICRRRAPPTTSIQATSSANSPRSRPKIPPRPSAW